MDSYTQLGCLVVSFLYGIMLFWLNNLNYKILCDKNKFVNIIGSILYIINVSLIYISFLYKFNNGILHIYFVLFIILGYIFISVKKRK